MILAVGIRNYTESTNSNRHERRRKRRRDGVMYHLPNWHIISYLYGYRSTPTDRKLTRHVSVAGLLSQLGTALMCAAFICTGLVVAGCESGPYDDPLRPAAGQITSGGLILHARVADGAATTMRTISGFAEIQARATTCGDEGLSALLADADAVWVKIVMDDDLTSMQVGGWALMTGRPNPERPNPERPNPERPNPERPNPDRRSTDRPGTEQLSVAGEMWIASVEGGPKRLCTAKGQVRMKPGAARVVLSERLSGGAQGLADCETTMEAVLRF